MVYADFVRGRLLLAGLGRLDALDARDAIALILACVAEASGPGSLPKLYKQLDEPYWATEANWGLSPQDREDASAMMMAFPEMQPPAPPARTP